MDAIEIGSARQLFIDDYVIEETDNLKRILHQPLKHSGNPVFSGEMPWERGSAFLLGGGQVAYDSDRKLFQMWYRIDFHDPDGEVPMGHDVVDTVFLCGYAESQDGYNWTRPILKQRTLLGSEENNLIGVGKNILRRQNIFLDEHETDPAKRYKMLYVDVAEMIHQTQLSNADDFAMFSAYSPDGIAWTPAGTPGWVRRHESGHPHHHPNIMGWDQRLQQYVLYPRTFVTADSNIYYRDHLRAIGRAVSDDFEIWEDTGLVLAPDEQDGTHIDFPGMVVIPYQDGYIGLLYCIHHEDENGKVDTQLTYSRDGIDWQRCCERKVFMPFGEPGSFDEGVNMPTTPLVFDDEIWFYYGGWNLGHGFEVIKRTRDDRTFGTKYQQCVGLAKLRLDGFVSLHAGSSTGTLTTKELSTPDNAALIINADATNGAIGVELLDREGKPLSGRELAECDKFTSNHLRHIVSWKGKSDLYKQPGQIIRLRFQVENAHLYSFQFSKKD